MVLLEPHQHPEAAEEAADDEDIDELISRLEETTDNTTTVTATYRERRIQQLHEEFNQARRQRADGYGAYITLNDEKKLMEVVVAGASNDRLEERTFEEEGEQQGKKGGGGGGGGGSAKAVVHFFKPEFGRCGVMDSHLDKLATKHLETRFVRINVDLAPFLVTKLKIQVLPCVLAFVDGLAVNRIVGFEGLGTPASLGRDFATQDLERKLVDVGVLKRALLDEEVEEDSVGWKREGSGLMRTKKKGAIRSKSGHQNHDDDDDSDWD